MVINVYPNSISMSGDGYIKFSNLPIDAKVFIYTLSGEILSFHSPKTPVYLWYCRNITGPKVSPGIYFYIIKWNYNREIKTGKIFVTR